MNADLVRALAAQAGIDVDSDTLCRYEGWAGPMAAFADLVLEEAAKVAQTHKGYPTDISERIRALRSC